jgi:hypothetical protein
MTNQFMEHTMWHPVFVTAFRSSVFGLLAGLLSGGLLGLWHIAHNWIISVADALLVCVYGLVIYALLGAVYLGMGALVLSGLGHLLLRRELPAPICIGVLSVPVTFLFLFVGYTYQRTFDEVPFIDSYCDMVLFFVLAGLGA